MHAKFAGDEVDSESRCIEPLLTQLDPQRVFALSAPYLLCSGKLRHKTSDFYGVFFISAKTDFLF